MRVGHGYDVHRFGDPLPPEGVIMLGGVAVPSARSLLAHSDGDVLLHALCDALLGGAALGDIGHHFPDTDPAFEGADSRQLLKATVEAVRQAGFVPHNVDLTLVAQRPRVAAYVPAMRARIATLLALDLGAVNVKATTTEGLGAMGREEGIAAYAVALLENAHA
ncbi:MAG: 2-C-methyl-D-erythritol 2,4-cyclodiphosphate synthase [Pseudomonadota bacterium]|nr:2-C-methyl-D-erythritol 2,4-cyclodiphosphate synthase [Pseudomonadota bacterium]